MDSSTRTGATTLTTRDSQLTQPRPYSPRHSRRRPRRSAFSSRTLLATSLALSFLSSPIVYAEQNLTRAQVDIVVQRLGEAATHSWEVGTELQALIELDTPSFSVLNDSRLPPSRSAPQSLDAAIQLITEVIQNKTATVSAESLSGPQPFWPEDGSSADPPSNGVAAIIANWTGQRIVDYAGAVEEQMQFLWDSVPRTDDGAISHRRSQVQLWSDFVFMVPPFLAYYGVLTQNRSMVEEAYNQCALYRQYLRDPDFHNLWRHVLLGSDFQDLGYWSTGNGWAAMGMLRVLGTIQNSEWRNALKGEVKDLKGWVNEIHDGMYEFMRDDGMFHNYANDFSSFVDASSAALLAASVYRHALLTRTYKHLPQAEFVRRALWAPSTSLSPDYSSDPHFTASQNTSFVDDSSLANTTHFDSEGWLRPVVNPRSFGEEGERSAEGQAFVVMMYAAWRDWVDEGAVGANGARRVRGEVKGATAVVWMGSLVLGVVVGWGIV